MRRLADPRRSEPTDRGERMLTSRFRAGANGRLLCYPLAAVASGSSGTGLGIDMARPAFYRIGYNSGTGELFLAYDLALTREKPSARIRLCHWTFDSTWGFAPVLARYYDLFPEAFRCRTPRQGNWMPFARISQVQNWQDFGFQFKEGDGEHPPGRPARHQHLSLYRADDLVDAYAQNDAATMTAAAEAEAPAGPREELPGGPGLAEQRLPRCRRGSACAAARHPLVQRCGA